MNRMIAWITAGLFAVTMLSAQAPFRMKDVAAGISVVKPQGWQVASKQENPGKVRLNDEDLLKSMGRSPAAPLFVFTRFPEPYTDLNPSIQVVLRPLGDLAGKTPVELMQATVEPLKAGFPDFHFLSEIEPATVGGLPGASMKAAYTLFAQDGKKYPTRTDLWIAPRGKFLFLIATAGPQEGPNASKKEFQQFAGLVEIQP